ncbi:4a-hydroxytetrahydrobiopterin dehydratase [Patescibacteria group bacterium]|nr:4a-hydroxytetrahydrobiopterin dehydratase [Patescibacteria group bacterium]
MEQDWKESGDTLEKTFRFKDFKVALSFVNDVGKIAERMNHHPDICIQNYNEVMISTTTHSEGRVVTQKDRKLARAIDSI